MKYIKIFIASSIVDFESERQKICNFINSLNPAHVSRGVYFEPVICENITNAINAERKQTEYNQEICDCQYFYVIVGQEAGPGTVEEFDVALKHFKETGAPKIYTYFLKLPEGKQPSESVIDFLKRLDKEIGHYFSTFSHIDTIQLRILVELIRDNHIGGPIELKDGQALFNGNAVLSMSNIPVYQKNTPIQELLSAKEKLEDAYAGLIRLTALDPGNETLAKLIADNEHERSRISEQLHTLEQELLQFYVKLNDKQHSDSPISWREKKAMELLDQGDYEGAKSILRDPQWSAEREQAEEIINSALVRIKKYISGKFTLIETIKSTGVTPEAEAEILCVFEDITALAEKYQTGMWILYEYADFLRNHNNHGKGIGISERLDRYYTDIQDEGEACAKNKYLLACMLYKTNDLPKAEILHKEALAIRKRLCASGSPEHLGQYASSCNQLGYLLFRCGKEQEAGQLYLDGIEVLRKLQNSGKQYAATLALTLNNLGNLARRQKDYAQAERCHLGAMELRKVAAADNSTSALGYLAMSCLNYAKLLTEMNQVPKADAYYQEASRLYNVLRQRDTKFQVDYAIAQYSYAAAMEASTPEEALKLHREVLEQRLMLAESNTAALRSDLSDSYYSIGKLLRKNGDAEAEAYLEQAFELRRALYQYAPEKYAEAYNQICVYLKK